MTQPATRSTPCGGSITLLAARRPHAIRWPRLDGVVRRRRLFAVLAVFSVCLGSPVVRAQSQYPQAPTPTKAAQAPQTGVDQSTGSEQASSQTVTRYTLPPDRYQKARSINQIRLWVTLVSFVWGVAALWLVLRWKMSARYRTWAEKAARRRFVQALAFTPLLILTLDVLGFPLTAFRHSMGLKYGLSVQGWGSWFWDWIKGELVSVVVATILVWVLYAIIRRSRRRWWVYFWLASLPIALALFFLQPLVIDPLFFQFESLAAKEPVLTQSLQRLVQRAGEDIPPERMFWMGAGEKLNALNAYVAGFGQSKRIVVWDTTIKRLTAPQIVYVAGHEVGHYVLMHIPKLLAFGGSLLFVLFYLGYRTIDWLLERWGASWEVRGLEDWASLPALLLLFSVFYFCAMPVVSAVGRHYEREADQYGLEVTHGLTADAAQACAQGFQALGDVNLDDPEPMPFAVFLYYDHPPIKDRVQFCLTYDPWSTGRHGAFVP
jgi:Zn-dependent protease with chaperone function